MIFFRGSRDGRTQGATSTPARPLCPFTDVRSCKQKDLVGGRLHNCGVVPRRCGVTGKKKRKDVLARFGGRLKHCAHLRCDGSSGGVAVARSPLRTKRCHESVPDTCWMTAARGERRPLYLDEAEGGKKLCLEQSLECENSPWAFYTPPRRDRRSSKRWSNWGVFVADAGEK